MASNREERFLMRQRGAGARQLRNSGFDFDLPGVQKSPLKSVALGRSRRTPGAGSQARALTKQTSKVTPAVPPRPLRRTPASRSTQNSKNSSLRQLPSRSKQQDVPSSQATKADEPRPVTKKRRQAGRPRTDSLSIYQEPPVAVSIFGSIPKMSEDVEPKSIPKMSEDVEPKSPTVTSGKKRKKRKSIGQMPKKRARTSLPDNQEQASGPLGITSADSSLEQRRPDLPKLETNQAQVLPVAVQVEPTKRKRRKRKSIGTPPKKRKLLDVICSSSLNVRVGSGELLSTSQQTVVTKKSRKTQKALASIHEDPENEIAEELPSTTGRIEEQLSSNIPSSSTQPRRRGRPRKSGTSVLYPTKTKVSKASTSKPRTQKRSIKPHPSSPIANPSETGQPKQKAGTIPITVHRISHTEHLNHDPTDEDILSGPPPSPNKSSVNAIDVLSQICRETIAKSIHTLKQNADKEQSPQRKAGWRRKTKAVEMFGDELDARLFEMSEAIDNNHGLTTRLRQANKTTSTKRDALLDIKRQREEIAVEANAVQAQHEAAMKITRDENDLDTMIQDIELAVQRGRAAQLAQGVEEEAVEESAGLELRLRKVAVEVSSVDRGGLLERVKGFNTLMEKILGDA